MDLKEYKKANNLTIRELSLRLGISERMIKYYLSGEHETPKKVLLAIKGLSA